MKFSELAANLPASYYQGETEVKGIAYSSKCVEPGFLFVAVPGMRVDGHCFLTEAIARGASAVAVSRDVELPAGLPVMRVENSRRALALLSSQFYGHPSVQMRMVGITGTNGKTTTAFLIRSILRASGKQTGLMGTVHVEIGEELLPAVHTTPEAPELQQNLRKMVDYGLTHAVMEVSSHAISMHRVDGVEYDTAVFTNLTQDHLDHHGTMDDYFQAKAQLFLGLGDKGVKEGKSAIINGDDPWGLRMLAVCSDRVNALTYGLTSACNIYAENIHSGITGSTFTLVSPEGSIDVKIPTPGKHSIYNALAAAGAALSQGCSLEDVRLGLQVAGVPGRMEPVQLGQSFGVYVDYAHTPDGLENVLQAVRGFAEGKVIVVFGCGGDRDRTKRPIMGAIAARLADVAILTSDNPRSEDPGQIIQEVIPGFDLLGAKPSQSVSVVVEIDRRDAIRTAIKAASPGDVVLIAGKGHETYQIFNDRTIHFDDREEARIVLREMLS